MTDSSLGSPPFFWAPSLVLRVFAPEQYSFGIWLLPGFYAAHAMGGY